eukprot:TRINITY_DN9023_c0_g1_i1.p1 TRINITY_DN9023_c0_g1~~TRINITY_DN9023_c0_g1_i1.p1  ORF type:complete len:673 (-),score=103.41 TRINITY_DN9023_c0_g1_i1:8-2026(-)
MKKSSKQTPQSRRRDNRRRAAYSVKHQEVCRRQLTPEEVLAFFNAIDQKSLSLFGIVKLSVLDLDGLYPVTSLPGRHLFRSQPTTTLLGYASARGRDEIVSALMRAGANPCIRSLRSDLAPFPKDLMDAAQNYLLTAIPTPYGVWIINKFAKLRESGLSRSEGKEVVCKLCGSEHAAHEYPASWPECPNEAIFCEACLWEGLISEENLYHEFFCPCGTCSSSLDPAIKEDGVFTQKDNEESFEKWSALPLELKSVQKRPRSQALPLEEAFSQYLGATQPSRTEEMWKVCATGQKARLVSIIRAGANLNEVNEYGQTVLFTAAFHNHLSLVKLFISLGVNVNQADNCGCTPAIVAAKRGHFEVLQALREAHADLDKKAFFGKSANDYLNEEQALRSLQPKETNIQVLIDFDSTHPGAGSLYADGFFSDEFLTKLDLLSEHLPVAPPSKASCSSRSYFCDAEKFVGTELENALKRIKDRLCETTATEKTNSLPTTAMSHTRFLFYKNAGGSLPAHVDLSRTDPISKITSTHTFILYLSDCQKGGETILLQHIRCGRRDKSKQNTPEQLENQRRFIEQQKQRILRKEQVRQQHGLSDTTTISEKQNKKDKTKTKKPTIVEPARDKEESSEIEEQSGILGSVAPRRGRLLLFPHLCPHEGGVVIDLPKTLIRGELY